MIRDRTGRFPQRPYYEQRELDLECERLIGAFLKRRHGEVRYPIRTEDLTVLLDQATSDFDSSADLSTCGADVDGVTDFYVDRSPRVRIANRLSEPRFENRFRTTATHELGHVKFHTFLYQLDLSTSPLFPSHSSGSESAACTREKILLAGETDWMEWQAGYISGAVLMPISVVKGIVGDVAAIRPLKASAPKAIELIETVQSTFQVSQDAARIRLIKLGVLVSDGRAQALSFETRSG
jgi:hypothetical protein